MKHPPTNHEAFIRRAVELAMQGRGLTEPNPSVGCVLVKDGRVIGEGRTQYYGGAHAEPTALANCTEDPRGATAYVTLEPCCHEKKQTPPCCPRLIGAGIARVVLGAIDPNPPVNGQGIAMLRSAGVEVVTGVLEMECNQIVAPFIARTQFSRPYVTMKWAQTADGKIAGPGGSRLQITGEESNQVVHQLRSRSQAILVGINTVLADDPLLTVRQKPTASPWDPRQGRGLSSNNHYFRYILDRSLRIPNTARLIQSANESPVIIAHSLNSPPRRDLERPGITLLPIRSLKDTLHDAAARIVSHLLIEPGPNLAQSFFQANLCDRLWIFQSSKSLDDPTAPSAANIPPTFLKVGTKQIGGDILTEYLNTQSEVFFAPDPSADFLLV